MLLFIERRLRALEYSYRKVAIKKYFKKNLVATNKKFIEDREQDIQDTTVAWVVEENLSIIDAAKKSFRRILE